MSPFRIFVIQSITFLDAPRAEVSISRPRPHYSQRAGFFQSGRIRRSNSADALILISYIENAIGDGTLGGRIKKYTNDESAVPSGALPLVQF
ncbi:hypothetical protein DIE21_01675 [Burkholderia sp. Bp9140]|nr:hypothetical protein DIE21_01675 [Burkholderia sp. Bp9140]